MHLEAPIREILAWCEAFGLAYTVKINGSWHWQRAGIPRRDESEEPTSCQETDAELKKQL